MGTFYRFDGELLTFDAMQTEDWTEDATVTEHPIQNGGFASDHRRQKPLKLTIEGIVSESPFEGQGRGILVEDTAGHRGLLTKEYFEEGQDEPFVYFSERFGQVPRLMIESLQVSTPKREATRFRLDLKQITYATAELVDVPREFIPKKGAEPIKRCGEQPTRDLTDAASGDNEAATAVRNLDKTLGDSGTKLIKSGIGAVERAL